MRPTPKQKEMGNKKILIVFVFIYFKLPGQGKEDRIVKSDTHVIDVKTFFFIPPSLFELELCNLAFQAHIPQVAPM